MKTVQKLLLASFLFMGAVQSVNAQSILSPEQQEQVAENVKNFLTDLNLSEKDKPAFREIIGDFFIGLAALRVTDFSPKTNFKIAKALAKGRDSRVKELLSSEQYKVYKAQLKEMRANMQAFMEQN